VRRNVSLHLVDKRCTGARFGKELVVEEEEQIMGPNTILGEMFIEMNVKTLDARASRGVLVEEAAALKRNKKSSPVVPARSHARTILARAFAWLQVAAPAIPQQSKSLH
jgi:hypothetical protein